jgi:hypothetical protein
LPQVPILERMPGTGLEVSLESAGEGACCANLAGTDSTCIITTEFDCVTNHHEFLGVGADCISDLACTFLVVTFDSLSADAVEGGVMIRWVTVTEIDTIGFRILREVGRKGSTEKRINVVAEMIPAAGHGLSGASYELLDSSKEAATAIHYFIEDIDIFGKVASRFFCTCVLSEFPVVSVFSAEQNPGKNSRIPTVTNSCRLWSPKATIFGWQSSFSRGKSS